MTQVIALSCAAYPVPALPCVVAQGYLEGEQFRIHVPKCHQFQPDPLLDNSRGSQYKQHGGCLRRGGRRGTHTLTPARTATTRRAFQHRYTAHHTRAHTQFYGSPGSVNPNCPAPTPAPTHGDTDVDGLLSIPFRTPLPTSLSPSLPTNSGPTQSPTQSPTPMPSSPMPTHRPTPMPSSPMPTPSPTPMPSSPMPTHRPTPMPSSPMPTPYLTENKR